MKPFTISQRESIERGRILNEQLSHKVLHALGQKQLEVDPKRPHYIASTPGAGKSFTVRETAAQYGVDLIKIHSVSTMSNFVTTLAYAAYKMPGEKIKIWMDESDSIFTDKESLTVMKGVLDEDTNMLTWNKNMTVQIRTYANSENPNDNEKAEALRKFQNMGGGIEVPTNDMTFVITANKFLTPPNSNLNTTRKMDEAAIRDRVLYSEYRLGKEESWGWVAYLLTASDSIPLDADQKRILLDWMYTNWACLPATSMRAIKEYGADMVNHPDNYPDYWDSKLM